MIRAFRITYLTRLRAMKAPASLAVLLFCSVTCAFAVAAESVESTRPEAEGAMLAPLQAADTTSPRDTLQVPRQHHLHTLN